MSAFRINHNSSAVTALNNLNATSQLSNKLQEQLSTGLRINSAADDPIGMIKSESFRTQIAGINQAKANAQEAINYIKTADANLSEINTLLQNARYYAVQAANSGVLDADQTNALNLQMMKNIESINSLATSSSYGTKKLLDGTAGVSSVSSDANTDYISFSGNFNGVALTPAATNKGASFVGASNTAFTALTSLMTASGTITINGTAATFTSGTTNVNDILTWVNGLTGVSATANTNAGGRNITITSTATGTTASFAMQDSGGVLNNATAVANTTFKGTQGVVGLNLTTAATQAVMTGTAATTYAGAGGETVTGAGSITLNNVLIGTYGASATIGTVVQDINNAKLGITASYSGNKVVLTSTNFGSDQSINLIDTGGIINALSNRTVTGVDAVANVTVGTTTVTFNKGKGKLLQDADGNQIQLTTAGNGLAVNVPVNLGNLKIGKSSFCIDPNSSTNININLSDSSANNLGRRAVAGKSLSNADLTTPDNVQDTLKIIDQAIKDVLNRRAYLGSIQKNTLESSIRSLTITKENLQASESEIRNLDFADAITQATMLQIRTQSGMAQLAQANTAPNAVLNLLRGQ